MKKSSAVALQLLKTTRAKRSGTRRQRDGSVLANTRACKAIDGIEKRRATSATTTTLLLYLLLQ